MLLTILSFLFAIGLLVTVHEYGHYRVARQLGVKVLTFSIGFGKPLLRWQRGETEWQIAAIPLGGFVKMLGEDNTEPLTEDEAQRAYSHLSPVRKMAIVAAGPLANLLLACVLFALALMIGFDDSLRPIVNHVRDGSVAEQAGVREGDEILSLGGREVADWEELNFIALRQLLANDDGVAVRVRHAEGVRDLWFDTSKVKDSMMDARILGHLGISPIPLLPRISHVEPDSPAMKAGLRVGDEIVAVNDQRISDWDEFQKTIAASPARELVLQLRRDNALLALKVTPVMSSKQGVMRIGVAPQMDMAAVEKLKFHLRLNPAAALYKGAQKTWDFSVMTLQMIGKMFVGKVSADNVSGPIGMASVAGQSAKLGIAFYINVLAVFSLGLGVLNLLPVPVLDGGHLLYHSAELVCGRPVPVSWQLLGQKIGVVMLISLMLLAFYNDINRFITG